MKNVISFIIGALITIVLIPFITADREKNNVANNYLINVAELPTTEEETQDLHLYLCELKLPTKSLHSVTEPYVEQVTETPLASLGMFTVTYYCACKKCCGKDESHAGYGITASGTRVEEGRTIATDTSVIPFGETVIINGHEYIAEDTGSSIVGNRIDIYVADHQRALELGVDEYEVFVKPTSIDMD